MFRAAWNTAAMQSGPAIIVHTLMPMPRALFALLAALVTFAALPFAAMAHPPGADGHHDDLSHHPANPAKMRLWTNAKTGEVVRGAFLAARRVDDILKVSIERENGDGGGVVVFAFDDLSEADRAEAQKKIDEVNAINDRLGAAAMTRSSRAQPGSQPEQATPQQVLATTPPPRHDPAWVTREVRAPRVALHTFRSAAAGGDVTFHLYTPPQYDDPEHAQRRFPVLYWLHGSGGGLPGIAPLSAAFDEAIVAGKIPPVLVVFVNGLAEGMYVDWADGSKLVESVIINDLIPQVDAEFRTIPARDGRVLDGFSMGGYGAARLGFKHTELFGTVSMIGAGPMQEELVQTPRAGRQRAAEVLEATYGNSQEYFRRVSPRRIAEEHATALIAGTRMRMVVGDRDETFANNVKFHDHLNNLGIPHQWKVLPGVAHDMLAVLAALGDEQWAFYRAVLAAPDVPASPKTATPPSQAAPFNAFAPFVTTRWDERWLYVESDGLPHVPGGKPGTYIFSHPMMVGITAWQQQVPLPHAYRGANAWQIPLKPEFADKPISAKDNFFRGAIALAANGVPIFNPIKNDGRTDTFLAGELDEFGGHCGRADDYHYHIAPLQLQKVLGNNMPIAYALDGFPIYGLFDPAAKAGGPDADKCCPLGGTEKLDELNGHYGATTKGPGVDAGTGNTSTVVVPGLYHYHASVKYPYLNGGVRGKVTVKDDQIDPQPRANPVREAGKPLRGASITGFKVLGEKSWSLEYTQGGKKHAWNYRIEGEGKDAKYIFEFVEPDGTKKTEAYTVRAERGQEQGRGRGGDDRPPRDRPPGDRAPREDRRPREHQPPAAPAAEPISKPVAGFTLSSADVTNGRLSIDCTCDAPPPHANHGPSLAWPEPPKGTKAFAVVMHHVPPEGGAHVYMVVANIPASARELKSGDTQTGKGGGGTWGQNTVNRKNEYAPPCSKGPGDKVYTITLYALSAEAKLPDGKPLIPLTRDALLAAIKDTTLATATLDVTYARASK